jgi:hypothetical protein
VLDARVDGEADVSLGTFQFGHRLPQGTTQGRVAQGRCPNGLADAARSDHQMAIQA